MFTFVEAQELTSEAEAGVHLASRSQRTDGRGIRQTLNTVLQRSFRVTFQSLLSTHLHSYRSSVQNVPGISQPTKS